MQEHDPSTRLALVKEPARSDRDADETEHAEDVAHQHDRSLRDGSRTGIAGESFRPSHPSGYASPWDQVPIVIRLTVEQVLEAADDADIRADIIADVAATLVEENDGSLEARRPNAQIHLRVEGLREVASDLRTIATDLMDRWSGSEGSP